MDSSQTDKHQAVDTLPFEWEGPAIGLLDLDAFFASVEQLDHPEWRGKPVIVGGSANKRGVVSTASYEARKFGVHSAMPSAQAERLCPDAIWTQGHYDRYREMSDKVMSYLVAETPLVEQVSIDEAFFDVTPGRFSRESPMAICQRVQRAVAELGVTCSIGIGVNKTVAKIASEREKPRGLTVVWPGTERTFLAPLNVSAMSGIGKSTQEHLSRLGIKTLGELSRADMTMMEQEFGVVGPRMVMRAAGLERGEVARIDAPEDVKSVSNERTFERDLTDRHEIEQAILYVASVCARRARHKGLAGSTVTLKLKYDACHGRTAQRRLDSPTDDEHVFGRDAVLLLDEIWSPGMHVRLVGVGLSHFGEKSAAQLDLFASDEKPARDLSALSRACDEIAGKYGNDAVSCGRDLRFRGRTSDTAPMNKQNF